MNEARATLSMDRLATYEIKVLGLLDESWTEWDWRMTIGRECKGDRPPVTVLTGAVDQAALQGLLRRLYAIGMPLLQVNCVDHLDL
jgi:hypothetical protein